MTSFRYGYYYHLGISSTVMKWKQEVRKCHRELVSLTTIMFSTNHSNIQSDQQINNNHQSLKSRLGIELSFFLRSLPYKILKKKLRLKVNLLRSLEANNVWKRKRRKSLHLQTENYYKDRAFFVLSSALTNGDGRWHDVGEKSWSSCAKRWNLMISGTRLLNLEWKLPVETEKKVSHLVFFDCQVKGTTNEDNVIANFIIFVLNS